MNGKNERGTRQDVLAQRSEELFQERFRANVVRTDRLFGYLMIGQWVFAIVLALVYSPYGWEGKARSLNAHVPVAIVLGGVLSGLPLLLIARQPGALLTRCVVGAAQMLWSALLIHLTGGRIETHFHVFGSLAFLAFYRDYRVLIPATLVVAGDHLLRQLVYPESVYGIVNPETWRFLEHAFWVVFEDVFLVISCVLGVREMRSIAEQQAKVELAADLEREMEIAARIQTGILPREPKAKGAEVAAAMIPAAEVGGDYYDVLPVEGGCWIGIGDVAGHGLIAGLVMLQAQAATKALVMSSPDGSPKDILCEVNRVIYDNVRHRLGHYEHMTMSLFRYHHDDGRLVAAGAHQGVLIYRAATGRCEHFPAEGTWLGLVEDIREATVEREYRLEEGDVLVLFTDGITEAPGQADELFGLERLSSAVEQLRGESADTIRDRLLAAMKEWSPRAQDDDVTVLVLRHVGAARAPGPDAGARAAA